MWCEPDESFTSTHFRHIFSVMRLGKSENQQTLVLRQIALLFYLLICPYTDIFIWLHARESDFTGVYSQPQTYKHI